MKSNILRTAAFVIAASLTGVPAIAAAATSQTTAPVHATYETSLQSVYGLSSPWTGTLQLTLNSDGVIQGYYHPDGDAIAFIPVTGGRSGDQVWLDIGRNGRLHVSGTFANGAITGGAIDQSTNEAYKFTARISG